MIIFAVTVLLVLDIALFPCLIICMIVFSSYGFREFAFCAAPFLLLFIVTITSSVCLSKKGYGKREAEPYLFHGNMPSTKLQIMMQREIAEEKLYQVEEGVLLVLRHTFNPDGFFLVRCDDIDGFAPEKCAEHCVESAIHQDLLPEKAYGLTAANLSFLFLVENTRTPKIQNVLNRNASGRLFHFYALLDQAGDLYVPAFWGSTTKWEKRYRRNLTYTLNFLENRNAREHDS